MKRILIIEDNKDNMGVLEGFFEDEFELLEAFDGKKGLEIAIKNKPDLILLDISLPIMDGTEVMKKIREDERIKHIPTIALTAHAMKGDRERLMKFGFDDYMSKPIVSDLDLIEMINRLIGEK